MKTCLPVLAAAVLAGSAQIAAAGDVSGKINLKGTPKPEVVIDLGPACGKINANKPTTRHYIVGKDGALANVFVHIKDAKSAPAKAESPVVDQVGCMYEPYIWGVVTGQKFTIKSSDPEMHNVHSQPKVEPNEEFNVSQLKGVAHVKTFVKPEVLLRIKCDVHPWMFTYAGVVEHPYFAITDKDGNYKISGLPDGKYTIEAYHLKTHVAAGKGVVKTIEVKGDTKQDFTVELAPAP